MLIGDIHEVNDGLTKIFITDAADCETEVVGAGVAYAVDVLPPMRGEWCLPCRRGALPSRSPSRKDMLRGRHPPG